MIIKCYYSDYQEFRRRQVHRQVQVSIERGRLLIPSVKKNMRSNSKILSVSIDNCR